MIDLNPRATMTVSLGLTHQILTILADPGTCSKVDPSFSCTSSPRRRGSLGDYNQIPAFAGMTDYRKLTASQRWYETAFERNAI